MNKSTAFVSELRSFERISREYCAWLMNSADAGTLAEALELMARLYAASIRLSGLELQKVELPDSLWVKKAERQEARARASQLPIGFYGEVDDPSVVPPDEPLIGDLVDDIVDIYCGLRAGLNAWEANDQETAAAHWQFFFRAHWGRHLVSAMKVLHIDEFG